MQWAKILLIVVQLALGGLFIYAGVKKFIPTPATAQRTAQAMPDENAAKISAYIKGLKGTGYFWPMLGVVELAGGLLLVTQAYALLGAVLLLPVTLNIFLFHAFLKPEDTTDLMLTALYLIANAGVILWRYPVLKKVFLTRL